MVIRDGRAISLGPPRQRLLLALLLGRPGETVTTDALVEAMWPRPPRSAVENVYLYVHRLRALLGKDRLSGRRRSGYTLVMNPHELDAARFNGAVKIGADALVAGDAATASRRLHEALRAWRGRPYEDVADEPAVALEVARLEESRLTALEHRIEADLALGMPADLIDELSQLVRRHPYRERFTVQLMRALHRCGRQTDALAAYRRTRDVLREHLGLEPGADLRRMERAILNGEEDAGAGAVRFVRRETPPAHLPADVPSFTARAAQISELDRLSAAAVAGLAMVTAAITGTAGVGKTTLAVHWARRAAGRFPDGQLYLNLRGFGVDGSAMSTAEAIRVFLDAFEVPGQRIPAGLPAQINLYRSLLAGRRVLVLLDNARDAEQVRPLLPGSPGCMVLVTSRRQLTGLVAAEGAQPIAVDLLTAPEARALLGRRLGDERMTAEPDAVEQIITRCAGLPLALAIVAARAVTRPATSLRNLVADLRRARDGLEPFTGDDTPTDVRAVLSWSYQTLSPVAAKLFRLLGGHPGPDFGEPAAASLAGVPVREVRPLLSELTTAHLLTTRTPGRYALHDLLRAYAVELSADVDSDAVRRAALHRMLDHYLHTAADCDALLSPLRDAVPLPPARPGAVREIVTSYEAAMRWFTAEHAVLRTTVQCAAAARFDIHAARLAWVAVRYYDRRGHWHDWTATGYIALACARRANDPGRQADAHRALGRAHIHLNRRDAAERHLRGALDCYGEIDDRIGTAYTHLNLNILRDQQGRYADALEHASQARSLFDGAGHPVGEALALNAVGWALARLGDHRRAQANCRRALVLHRRSGNRHNEATTWDSLGYAHHHLGEHQQAIACYERALDIYREVDSRYYAAETLVRLADTHDAVADTIAARSARRHALTILDELGHAHADQVRARILSDDLEGRARPVA